MTMILIRYTGDAPRSERQITGRGKRWWPGELRAVPEATATTLAGAGQGWEVERGEDAADMPYLEGGQVFDPSTRSPVSGARIATFSALPTASSVPGMLYFVENVGRAGAYYRSVGNEWVHAMPAILYSSGAQYTITGRTDEVAFLDPIPLVGLTKNSVLRIEPSIEWTNNANGKTWAIKIGPDLAGATTIETSTRTTNKVDQGLIDLAMRGSLTSQILVYKASRNYAGNNATGSTTSSIDLSGTNYLFVTGQLAVGTDSLDLRALRVTMQ